MATGGSGIADQTIHNQTMGGQLGRRISLKGHIKKQASTCGEAGVVGEIVIQFLTEKNPGAIEAMPKLQAGGVVEVTIESLQEELNLR